MYILAKLVFESYIPVEFTKGMLFKQRIKDVIYGHIYEYDRIFALNVIPQNREEHIITNGYPVKPVIVSITANADNHADILATSDMIGWWDESEFSDELRDIEIKDMNYVLQHDDGILEIEIADHMFEHDIAEPVLYDGKVTLRIVTDEEFDDYEDWDDMDDLTDEDHNTE